MKTIRHTAIAVAAFCAAAGTTFQAQANEVTEVVTSSARAPQQLAVNFGDLDLSSAKGQEVLYYRLSRAAEAVCGSDNVRITGSVSQATRNASCHDEALSRALSEVHRTAVASTN